MMLATWDAAHPFAGSGRWAAPGGDFDPAGCQPASQVNGQSLLFDVTQWFIDFPRGRGVNYGLIMVAIAPVTILGDNSGSYSPRILWNE
jgi:hypothetical protein